MNKLGVVHSGYKLIIPIGNRICFRFMLDDYQKGNFWDKIRADHDPWSKYVYLFKRTYYEQLYKAIKEKPEEIFFVIDTPINDFHSIQEMIQDLVQVSRSLGYTKKIIISAINEPLEHMNQKEIHWLNNILSIEIRKYVNVYLAVGEMACDFYDYYRSYKNVNYHYDYISFHTDNHCDLDQLKEFIRSTNFNKPYINNEHYSYYGSQDQGYDNHRVVEKFKKYTEFLINRNKIKSIYICMPFHYYLTGKYKFLGLNLVDFSLNNVYQTEAWKMLKQYDIKAVIKMYLWELKKDGKGVQVRCLQKALNKALDVNLKIDGVFGSKTEAELKNFNTKHNISSVIICTYDTWYELLQDLQTEVIVKDLIDLLKVIE